MKFAAMTVAGKLWHLLAPKQRRTAFALLMLMLVGMVLETLGIGLVIPALALMTQTDLAAKYPMLTPGLVRLGNPSHEHLVVAGMLTLFGIYLVKAIFLAFLAWRQATFVFRLQADLSQRLFAGYLRQPYAFHLQRNSAQLIRNTINQVGDNANAVQQALTVITEVFVLFGITALLLSVEPLGTLLVMSALALAGWGFNRVTGTQVYRWGEARQHHEQLRLQHLLQGFGGAKDVKLLGREDDFLAKYWLHNSASARIGMLQASLQALPRLWLELLAVAGMAALALTMIAQGKPVEALLPTLGLFAAAAFRLIPSVNRVLGAVQGMRFSLPAIDSVFGEFQLLDVSKVPLRGRSLPFKHALTLDLVSFKYLSADVQALREVTLSIPKGCSVGVIGGSGAGKSTLVDIILGLLVPTSGAVMIDGVDIQTNVRGWQDLIGYVPQSIFLTDDSLRRNVAFGLPDDQIDERAVLRAVSAAQLDDLVRELPQGLGTLVGERGVRLSGGQRQRIGIARALYHNPPVLVLDEATSSLDTATERGVMDSVTALHGEKTVIIVAHRLSTVEHCDRLYRVEHGKVVEQGTCAELLGCRPGTTQ